MPSPSSPKGLRPRSALARRLGALLLVTALVLTVVWVLGGGGGAAEPPEGAGPRPLLAAFGVGR